MQISFLSLCAQCHLMSPGGGLKGGRCWDFTQTGDSMGMRH